MSNLTRVKAFVFLFDVHTNDLSFFTAMEDNPPPQDKDSLDPAQIPRALLFSFFENAKGRLNEHPNNEMQHNLLTENGKDEMIPVSLASQRHLLLQEQFAALKTSISEYNLSRDKVREVQEEEVQDCLRELGQNDFSKISTIDQIDKNDLLKAMTEMNDAARSAFARSVLWAEVEFSKEMLQKYPLNEVPFQGLIDYEKGGRNLLISACDESDGMTRSAAIEFSGLCTTAVHLPEVKRYFETGLDLFSDDELNQESQNRMIPPQHRFLQFQQMMLCAVGYEPKFGGEELRKLMVKDDTPEDTEVFNALSTFVLAMQDAAKNVFTIVPEELSDETEGGVTRIVSVEHTEKMLNEKGELVDSQGSAPTAETIRNDDKMQKHTFDMAQKAATLQSQILKELLSMDESNRIEVLKEASEANESFLAEVVALPPGPERVSLIQNIGQERQSLLLKHKLWQQYLAK